jgi:uncharacterized protein
MRAYSMLRGFLISIAFGLRLYAQNSSSVLNADKEGPSNSSLIRAIVQGDLIQARKLVERGFPPNVKDQFGGTPLGVAITTHHSDFVQFLIERGADVNLADRRNTSPLMSAAFECDTETAKYLLQHGATPDHQDQVGETPLSFAADACNNPDMIKLLLAFGARTDTRNEYGDTPLIEAAFSGNAAIVRELIQSGADLAAKNNQGETAETKACERQVGRNEGHDKVCSFIRAVAKR